MLFKGVIRSKTFRGYVEVDSLEETETLHFSQKFAEAKRTWLANDVGEQSANQIRQG